MTIDYGELWAGVMHPNIVRLTLVGRKVLFISRENGSVLSHDALDDEMWYDHLI
jgi:hypothetical protein